MQKLWTAEQVVQPDMAIQLIEQQFPQLAPVNIESFGQGWDNTVYLVNDEWVFRFPRRQLGADLIVHEVNLLNKIADMVTLEIPRIVFNGEPTDIYKWPFIGYTRIPGQTACTLQLTCEERIKMSPVLGRFLKELHSFDVQKAQELGVPDDVIGRLDIEKRLPAVVENIHKLKELELIEDAQPYIQLVERSADRGKKIKLVLAHGDLYVRHIMINKDRTISGIIDWGDMHIGDPAVDLAIVHSFLPKEAHKSFQDAYGKIAPETWELARFRALYHASILVLYGHDIQDQDLVREGLWALNEMIQCVLYSK